MSINEEREAFYSAAEDRILCIYPQQRYHHNAYIVGGKAGLTALRDALNEVLDDEPGTMGLKTRVAYAHPGDDEVFGAFVIMDHDLTDQEERDGCWADNIPLPYYDKNCAEQLKDGAVSLAPNENHVMAAGVAAYLINKSFEKKEKKGK